MDPARDTTLVESTPIDYLDFASPVSGLGSKMGIDATNKWPGESERRWGRPIVMDAAVKRARPLHDRVIVKRLEEERKTAGGIVIPDTAAEKPDQGEVVAVGKGKIDDEGKLSPLDVKVGDKILFGKYSGQTVKVEGDELLVMREEDIMGVIEAR